MLGERQRRRRAQRAAAKRARAPASSPGDYFEAWWSGEDHAPLIGELAAAHRAEQEREARRSHEVSRTLHTMIGAALVKFGGAEPTPELERDIAAEKQRAAAIAPTVPRQSAMAARGELAAALNVGHGARINTLIERCREQIEDEDAQESRALVPVSNRRQRPASKADVTQAKIHREARVMAAAIVNSRGAHVIQSYLLRLRPIFSGQPLAALRLAALGPLPQGGFRWTYADDCARRVIAEGLMFLVVGRWTNQRTAFGSRSNKRGLLIAGLTVRRILRAVTPVGRKPYDRHVFSSRTGWLGDMARFEASGFALRKRLPVERLNSWECGKDDKGRAQGMNRYWIGCVVAESGSQNRKKNRTRAPTAFGEVLPVVVFSGDAHERGWLWAEETISYAPQVPF